MSRQTGSSALILAAVLAFYTSCGSKTQPIYDTPPTLANRDEVTDALRAVGSGIDARVVLQVNVNTDGRVTDVRISRSSGQEGLDDAARWVGERMRFNPALHEGKPVAALVEVPVTFAVVSEVARPPRVRNEAEVIELIIREYGELDGSAILRVRVNSEGSVNLVKSQRGSSGEVTRAAGKLVHDLEFWPAYKNFRPVEVWINLTIEFAGMQSRFVVEAQS